MNSISKGFEIIISKRMIVVLVPCHQKWHRAPHCVPGKDPNHPCNSIEIDEPSGVRLWEYSKFFHQSRIKFLPPMYWGAYDGLEEAGMCAASLLGCFPVKVLVCAEL